MGDRSAGEDAAGLEACTAAEGVMLAGEEAQRSVSRPATQSGQGEGAGQQDSSASAGDGASDLADAAAPDVEPPSRPASSPRSDSPTAASPLESGAGNTAEGCWQLQLVPLDDGSVAVSIRQQLAGTGEAAAAQAETAAPVPLPPELSVERAQTDDAVATQQQQQLEQLRALQEERQALLDENQRLQWSARQYIDSGSKASKESMREASSAAGVEQRYALGLAQLQRLLAQAAAAEANMHAALAPQKEKLVAAQARADASRQALGSFVCQVAEASKRGAPGAGKAAVSDKVLRAFLEQSPVKAAEVAALRLKNAALQHRIAAAEQQLKDSDRLSDGLHLIDFEQLKIENSTLSYKMEARNAEVLKLRTKLAQTIQMAAHAKEKLHCAEQEKKGLEARLASAEAQLQKCRLELAAAKARREQLQNTRAELRQDWNVITDRRCLADMKAQEAKLVELLAERERLQQTYQALNAKCKTRRAS